MHALNASVRNTLALGIVLSLVLAAHANAQGKGKSAKAKAPAPAASEPAAQPSEPAKIQKEDKVDVSDLENKYWAPKDTDFSVVQNRTYTKEKRMFATIHYGPIVNDKYSEGNNVGLSANYFFSERYGIQATYIQSNLEDSDMVNAFKEVSTGVRPDFGRMENYYGFGFSWVPFYAKMSFMGKKIMYFDMAVTPTLGMTNYTQMVENDNRSKSSLTYGVDITQYFFFTNHFAIRADLKNQWYSEEVLKYRGSGGALGVKGDKVRDDMNHTTLFLLGLTFYF